MNRTPNTLLAALIALLLPALAIPAAASAGPVSLRVDQPAGVAGEYWTKARMRAAEPVPAERDGTPESAPAPAPASHPATHVPPASPGSAPDAHLLRGAAAGSTTARPASAEVLDPTAKGVRAHGKVYFSIRKGAEAGDYVCSGTTINSRRRSVVLTAGHCVYDSQAGGGKARNWIFVPAYEEKAAPFGAWEAKKLATTKQWKKFANLRFDLGMAVVRRNSGQRLQSVVGARGIGFDQPRKQSFDIFGYPALPPFDGEHEFLCSSAYQGTDIPGGRGPNTMAADCDMTGGSSGGGWVVGRTVVSVVSYGYEASPGVLYGPYLSSSAKKLYKSVRGKKR